MQIAAPADRVSTTATRAHTSTSPRTAPQQPSPSRSTVTRLAGSRRPPTTSGPPLHCPPWNFSTRHRACPNCACPRPRPPTTTGISPAPCPHRTSSRPRGSSQGLPPTRRTARLEQCPLPVLKLRPRLRPTTGHGRLIRPIIQGYPGKHRDLLPTRRSLLRSSHPHHSKRNIPPPRTHLLPILPKPLSTLYLPIIRHSHPIARPRARHSSPLAAIVFRLRLRRRTRLRWRATSLCSISINSI